MRVTPLLLLIALALLGSSADRPAPEGRELRDYGPYLLQAGDKRAARAAEDLKQSNAVKVTFLGTTTLLFDDGETQLMIDGFITRPSLWKVITQRVGTNPAVVDAALRTAGADRLKAVFVSHTHYDHVLDVVHIVKGHPGAQLLGSPSARMVGLGGGLTDCTADAKDCQVRVFEEGAEYPVGDFSVKVIASAHSPPTLFNDDLGESITKELRPPVCASEYAEGGTFDFLIRHRSRTILVKASANVRGDALKGLQVQVLFLATGRLGKQNRAFQEAYYEKTVGLLHPKLVIPIHWDDFFVPIADGLRFPSEILDDSATAFNFLIRRINSSSDSPSRPGEGQITFLVLQAFESVVLFREDPESVGAQRARSDPTASR